MLIHHFDILVNFVVEFKTSFGTQLNGKRIIIHFNRTYLKIVRISIDFI